MDDDATYVDDDVTYVYDDVTYVDDDVTYIDGDQGQCRRHVRVQWDLFHRQTQRAQYPHGLMECVDVTYVDDDVADDDVTNVPSEHNILV